ICHFCTKRVYVMERLSAEGFFFHRECFRCDVCNCTLRLGGHTFDSQEGALHFNSIKITCNFLSVKVSFKSTCVFNGTVQPGRQKMAVTHVRKCTIDQL
uniref:LIM zinc-binding domain-containing protein n=1 Tax=Stegastes partitus TaxID=144197 RepID=A0A3B5AIJ5_9TELE